MKPLIGVRVPTREQMSPEQFSILIQSIVSEASRLRDAKTTEHTAPVNYTWRGDADFTVSDYPTFKKTYLGTPGFAILEKPNMEMIELSDPAFNVLAYFSNPPLGKVLNIR